MDTKQVVARFEAERQALALMDHPNIAKVLDAGATETGRPFFVMELVRGIKITDYCDQNNLPTAKRLALFVQVCKAVQHAHQKGIIHRDLKPSNILVTLHDGVPVPKVIDFGIAKATCGQTLTERTLFTAFEQFIGTPAYMSPEQAEMSGLDIDTRSDTYSLGVLLYELLTGKTPFDHKDLLAAGLAEMRRIIREEDPVRPSTRISSLEAAEQTTVARRRQLEAPRLVHLVRGDLDWSVMKCLEKDRTLRYETTNGLANDVQRYLENEAIVARPPSQLYRFQKMVRRHKLVFAAASAVTASLVIGLGLCTWLFFKERHALGLASREARRSQQVALLLEGALKGVGPSVALGRDTKLLTEIMDKTQEQMAKALQDEPEMQADLCNTIGEVYRALGKAKKAKTMYETALSLQEKAGLKRTDMTATLEDLALVLRDLDRFDDSEKLHREVLELRRKSLGNEHTKVAIALNHLALTLRKEHKLAEAERYHREALDMQRKLLGTDNVDVATSLNNLALVLREEGGKSVEATESLREALAIQEKVLGDQSPFVALTMDNLAFTLREQGKLDEAESLELKALPMLKRLMTQENPAVVTGISNLAHMSLTLRQEDKLPEAELLDLRVLPMLRNLAIDGHPAVATALNNLALIYQRQHKLPQAEELYREALGMRQTLLGENLETASSLNNLALLLRDPGWPEPALARLKEAEDLQRQALATRQTLLGGHNIEVAVSLYNLGLILRDQNRLPEAEKTFRDALATDRKLPGDVHPYTANFFGALLEILVRQHKFEEVEAVAGDILTPQAEQKPHAAGLLRARGDARARTAHWKEAMVDFSRVIELEPANAEAYHSMAALLAQGGDLEAYERHCALCLARFGAINNPLLAVLIARDCLVLPAPGVDLMAIGRLAATTGAGVATNRNTPGLPWVKALAEYHQGKFGGPAADLMQNILSSQQEGGLREMQGWLVLAMARQKSKQFDDARAAFAKAAAIAKTKIGGDLGRDWADTLMAQALLREAAALIESRPPATKKSTQ